MKDSARQGRNKAKFPTSPESATKIAIQAEHTWRSQKSVQGQLNLFIQELSSASTSRRDNIARSWKTLPRHELYRLECLLIGNLIASSWKLGKILQTLGGTQKVFPLLHLAGSGTFTRGRGDLNNLSLSWAAGELHGTRGLASESRGMNFTQAGGRGGLHKAASPPRVCQSICCLADPPSHPLVVVLSLGYCWSLLQGLGEICYA